VVNNGMTKLRSTQSSIRLSHPKFGHLIKQKLISINDKYVLATSQVFFALDGCLMERPVSIDALNDFVENVRIPFIKPILIIGGYWFLATQIDTFIRNDTALDPCATNTILFVLLYVSCVEILAQVI
jgi:hypothetical protein